MFYSKMLNVDTKWSADEVHNMGNASVSYHYSRENNELVAIKYRTDGATAIKNVETGEIQFYSANYGSAFNISNSQFHANEKAENAVQTLKELLA